MLEYRAVDSVEEGTNWSIGVDDREGVDKLNLFFLISHEALIKVSNKCI